MIDWKLSIAIASSTAGAGSSVVLGMPISETQRALAIGVIVIFALFFGSLARLATSKDGDSKAERRKALMTFGSLYIISLFMANKLHVDILGAALIAVGVGAAGPLIIVPLAEGLTRAAKAFFNRTD